MNNSNESEKGSVAILFALFLTVMMGFLALVADLGYLYAKKAYAQNYADEYALFCEQQNISGTNPCPTPPDSFYDASFTTTVSPAITPPDNSLCVTAEQSECIKVDATLNWTPFFSGLYGVPSTLSVSASATAARISENTCVLALNSGALGDPPYGGIEFDAGGTLTTNNCNIGIKTAAITSFYLRGAPTITANGGRIQTEASLALINQGRPGVMTPSPTQVSSISNPFLFLDNVNWASSIPRTCTAAPNLQHASGNRTLASGRYCSVQVNSGGGTITLNPGYFDDGIKINSGYSTVTFNPGIYYLNTTSGGNSLHIDIAGEIVANNGVTFINLGGTFLITNNPKVSFMAPTTDIADYFSPHATLPVKGMSYIQIQNENASLSINPSSPTQFAGNFYLPSGDLTLILPNLSSFNMGALVANHMIIDGGALLIVPQATDGGSFGSNNFILAK